MDFSNSSKLALDWAITNLADKGDTLYIIHINSATHPESRNKLWEESGSRKFSLRFYSSYLFLFFRPCRRRNFYSC